MNKTIKEMIAKSSGDLKAWDEDLELIIFFYNASVQMTTGFAPTELATGRRPTMPVEGSFEAHPTRRTYVEYVDETMERMRKASKAVYETTRRNQALQRREFDKRLHGKALEVGDLVRVKFQGKPEAGVTTKLLSRWKGPYEVVEKIGEKTYVVMMEYRGKMAPRVANFRNLWKVGRMAKTGNEETDLEGFPEEGAGNAERMEGAGNAERMEGAGNAERMEGAGEDAGSDAELDGEMETAMEDRIATGSAVEALGGADGTGNDAEHGGSEAPGDAEGNGIEAERGGSEESARGTMELREANVNGDNLRRGEKEANVGLGDNMRRIFTRRGREVRPPRRFDS